MKKKILITETHGSPDLARVFESLCDCSAESVLGLSKTQERINQASHDYLVVDPYYFNKQDFRIWLENLRLRVGDNLKIIFLSSSPEIEVNVSYQLVKGKHYDYFVFADVWKELKDIINN